MEFQIDRMKCYKKLKQPTLYLPVTMNFNWAIQFIIVRMEFQFSLELKTWFNKNKYSRFNRHDLCVTFPYTLPPLFLSINLLELTVPENCSLFGMISLSFETKQIAQNS